MKEIVIKWKNTNLILKILCGILIGAVLGLTVPGATPIGYLGTLFVSTLKAIAPILVFVLVMSSISKAGSGIGAKFTNVIVLYMLSTFIAAFLAVMMHYLLPLTVTLTQTTTASTAPQSLSEIFENLLSSIVENPVSALSGGNYLGILFWAVVIGLGLKMTKDEAVIHLVEVFSNTISSVVGWVIQCAPFGILGVVFFTRSSAANIPINMALCEKLGLDRDFYSVSIPLGSTINMDGAAVVITIMSLTLANTLGIQVPIPMAILLAIISTLGACGTSGVAGGSLLLIPMACSLLGIPGEVSMQMVAVGFVISVIQDSMETALNSSSDVAFTATAEKMTTKKK